MSRTHETGSVRLFKGGDLTSLGTVALGDDADNVRIDESVHRVRVGYGSGALAVKLRTFL